MFHDLGLAFAAVARQHAGAPALIFDERMVSYEELDRLANGAAHLLHDIGVGRGGLVALALEKSPAVYILIVACLKLGAPYCVLDPASPAARSEAILARCRPALVIGQPGLAGTVGAVAAALGLAWRDDAEHFAGRPAAAPPQDDAERSASSPAYVMFTSGSTGEPKGAVIAHGAVLAFAEWSKERFAIGPGDRLSNVNPLYFDNSVFDLYTALLSGAALVPVARPALQDPGALVQAVLRHRCTVWFSVPSLLIYLGKLRILTPEHFKVRLFVFGGEGYPLPELRKLYDLFGARARLINVYGPTETTCICSAHEITEADLARDTAYPTLGRLNEGFRGLILDEGERPVEEGGTGELWLLGTGVGLGYYADPERSAASFRQNPLQPQFREIAYRTGDLVRRDRDGLLWFVGRRDNQIKHMGYRIELEEIEAALRRLPGVREAVAWYRPSADGPGRLRAAVGTTDALDPAGLRRALQAYLPVYMVPHDVQILGELPKNANGKVDRRAFVGL